MEADFKYFDTQSTTSASTTYVIQLLNGIQYGDSQNQKTGNKVDNYWIDCRYTWQNSVNDVIRVITFYDKQANGNTPALLDVLQTSDVCSPLNWNNTDRFEIYNDYQIAISVSGPNTIAESYSLDVPETTYYNGGDTGTVSDITTGALYVLYLGTQAINTTAADVYTRLHYT